MKKHEEIRLAGEILYLATAIETLWVALIKCGTLSNMDAREALNSGVVMIERHCGMDTFHPDAIEIAQLHLDALRDRCKLAAVEAAEPASKVGSPPPR